MNSIACHRQDSRHGPVPVRHHDHRLRRSRSLPQFNGGDVQIRRWRPGCQCFHPARWSLSTFDASPPTCTETEAEPSKRQRDKRHAAASVPRGSPSEHSRLTSGDRSWISDARDPSGPAQGAFGSESPLKRGGPGLGQAPLPMPQPSPHITSRRHPNPGNLRPANARQAWPHAPFPGSGVPSQRSQADRCHATPIAGSGGAV